jgi:hypothetical protein
MNRFTQQLRCDLLTGEEKPCGFSDGEILFTSWTILFTRRSEAAG